MARFHRLVHPTLACLAAAFSALAHAQPPSSADGATPGAPPGRPPTPPTGWQTDLGVAVIANPEFQGSSDYQLLPVPYFDVRYNDAKGTLLFANVPQGLGAYVLRSVNQSGRRLAVSAAIAPGFANRDADDLEGLDTFGPAVEGRLNLEYGSRRFGLQATAAQAIATGHEGFYIDLGASWRWRVGQAGFASVGPSVRWGDDNYIGGLYSVSAQEAARTGLAPSPAGAGIESVGVQGILSLPITGKWRWTSVARIGALQGDASDSSLTDSELQAFVLMAFTRRL